MFLLFLWSVTVGPPWACLNGDHWCPVPWTYVPDVRGSGNPTKTVLWEGNICMLPLTVIEVIFLVPGGNTWLGKPLLPLHLGNMHMLLNLRYAEY